MATVLPPEIAALMGTTVIAQYESPMDKFGKVTYTTRGTYKCYPVVENKQVRTKEGRDDQSTATLYINSDDITSKDQIMLRGEPRVILSIETWYDQNDAVWGQVVYVR